MQHIILGSKSPLKVQAVRSALRRLDIGIVLTSADVPSGENAQPYGEMETRRGANTRAVGARRHGGAGAWGLGIESGILELAGGWVDAAYVVLIGPRDEWSEAITAMYRFPQWSVDEARLRGFATTTAGGIVAETLGGQANDPIDTLSGGYATRAGLLEPAISKVLRRMFGPK